MGNQQSTPDDDQILPISPLITKLRSYIKITLTNKKTPSFINFDFAQQIKKSSGFISRQANPFCPIIIQPNKNNSKSSPAQQQNTTSWLSCCIISPIMAIASPLQLVDQNGKYNLNAKIQALSKTNGYVQYKIQSLQVIQEMAICILILQHPVLQFGWAGISYLQKEDQIRNQSYKIINHPKYELDQKTNTHIYHQQINKAFYKLEQQFVGSFKTMPGSLIFKIIDKKPYIVGIQVSQKQAHFFTKQIAQAITQTARKIVTKKRQHQILKIIDLQQLQLMEKL